MIEWVALAFNGHITQGAEWVKIVLLFLRQPWWASSKHIIKSSCSNFVHFISTTLYFQRQHKIRHFINYRPGQFISLRQKMTYILTYCSCKVYSDRGLTCN